jgi:hypothetical protein
MSTSKQSIKLLASAPSEEALRALIAKYWCTSADRIKLEQYEEDGTKAYVIQGGKLMFGFQASYKSNRYRFEAIV